jgi:hypothetical protein
MAIPKLLQQAQQIPVAVAAVEAVAQSQQMVRRVALALLFFATPAQFNILLVAQ